MTIMMTTMTIMMTNMMMMGLLPLFGVVRLDCGARAHLLLQRERVKGFEKESGREEKYPRCWQHFDEEDKALLLSREEKHSRLRHCANTDYV